MISKNKIKASKPRELEDWELESQAPSHAAKSDEEALRELEAML